MKYPGGSAQMAACALGCLLVLLAVAAFGGSLWSSDLLVSKTTFQHNYKLRETAEHYERKETVNKSVSLDLGESTKELKAIAEPDPVVACANATPEVIIKEVAAVAVQSRTDLQHILFGIGSSAETYSYRKELVRLWWLPDWTRGFVWLDNAMAGYDWQGEGLPEAKVSEDTSDLPYNHVGPRSCLRIARIVLEAYRLDLPDVRWFVMGDDDTIFNPEALAQALAAFDHTQMLFLGAGSEMFEQMQNTAFDMAFGGAGFAISRPLARALAPRLDDCIRYYSDLYGSDGRVHACAAELGVQMTRLRELHQWDVTGNVRGLLQAYRVGPLLSMHHVMSVDPVFPGLSHMEALQRVTRGMHVDPQYFLETAVCLDMERHFTAVVSWGYSVRFLSGLRRAGDLQKIEQTFSPLVPREQYFTFNTRWEGGNDWEVSCDLPFNVFVDEVRPRADGSMESEYSREATEELQSCSSQVARVSSVTVVREAARLPGGQSGPSQGAGVRDQWQCCRSLTFEESGSAITIVLGSCIEEA